MLHDLEATREMDDFFRDLAREKAQEILSALRERIQAMPSKWRPSQDDILHESTILGADFIAVMELDLEFPGMLSTNRDATKIVVRLNPRRTEGPGEMLNVILHEVIHAYDIARMQKPSGLTAPKVSTDESPSGVARKTFSDRRAYLQNPLEFNAWFQTGIEELSQRLSQYDSPSLPDDFEVFAKLAAIISQSFLDLELFLNKSWHRKYRVRLWQFYSELKPQHPYATTPEADADIQQAFARTRFEVVPKWRVASFGRKPEWRFADEE